MNSFENSSHNEEENLQRPEVLLEKNIRIALKQAAKADKNISLEERKKIVCAEYRKFLEKNGYQLPDEIEEAAKSFYFCINVSKELFEDEVQEELYAPENLKLSREEKKAIIRKKCLDICTNIYRFDKDISLFFAMPLFKYLENNPSLYDRLWNLLYKISENAEDKEKVTQFFAELNELHPTGSNYLWILAHSIVRGDYEVLKGAINNEPFYFLHIPGNIKERNKNQNRIASSIAIKKSMEGKLIKIPIPGLRRQDFVNFDEREEEIFRTIFGTFKQDIDTLLFASASYAKILKHINWALDFIKQEIDSSDATDFDKNKYHMFVDQLAMSEYFSDLLEFAKEMSKKEHDNPFAKDILNEPFLIRNRLLTDDGTPNSLISYLQNRWTSLLDKFKKHTNKKLPETMEFDPKRYLANQSPAVAETQLMPAYKPSANADINKKIDDTLLFVQVPDDDANNDEKDAFLHPSFTDQEIPTVLQEKPGTITLLIAEEIGRFSDVKPEKKSKKPMDNSQFSIGFIAPGSVLEKQKMREIQQIVKEAFADELNKLKEAIDNLKPLASNHTLRKQLITTIIYELNFPKENNADEKEARLEYNSLYTYLRGLFTELLSGDNNKKNTAIPTDSELECINNKLPRLDTELKAYLEKKGLLKQILENEAELERLLLIEIQELKSIVIISQRVKHALESINGLTIYKSELQTRLANIAGFRKKVQGGRLKRWFRDEKLEMAINKYFDQLEEYIETLWADAIEPTINNFEAAYFI